jgi:hypothetical protein
LNLVNVLNHGDPTVPSAAAPITCILPMANHVYTGDEEGRVVSYLFFLVFLLVHDVGANLMV